MKNQTNTNIARHYYIDALRVLAIMMMFIYHINMIFVSEWGWHIKNSDQSNVLMEFNYWMAFFRMPLLFFVSGFISCVLLEQQSNREFTIQRFYRLILPTVIWTFILIPPQIYLERKLQGSALTYVEFYLTFLQFKWWPNGNFHWLHLWFIPYLFVYNILSIPLYRVIQKKMELECKLGRRHDLKYIFLFIFLASIPQSFLTYKYPVTYDLLHDFARHSFFLFFIIAGIMAYSFKSILENVEAKRSLFLKLAFCSIVIINIIRWNKLEPHIIWVNWLENPITYIFNIFLNINSWLWLLALIGYGRHYLNRDGKLLRYLNTAIYPFYILHQTIIVIIGYYVVQTQDNSAFKYLFLLSVCFCVTFLTYHLYIRPYKIIRFLFGVK